MGNRIYSLDFDPFMAAAGMMPMEGEGFSIGFGGGYVMLGTTSMVEDGLRADGGAQLPMLTASPFSWWMITTWYAKGCAFT